MPNFVLVRIVLSSALFSALVGGAYAHYAHNAFWTGVVLGAVFGAIFSALEGYVFQGEAGARLRRRPFLVYFSVRSAVYVVLIVMIEAVGVWLLHGRQGLVEIRAFDVLFALVLSAVGNLIYAIADLLGPGVLFAFAAGRYHRPRREERALLFIDLRASTAAAERLGETRFLDFLDAFIVDVSHAIIDNGGEIHKYVGDEIIATWRLKPGRNDAGIVRACFGARDQLAARVEAYKRDFGVGADFRAALHGGPVVVGEVGSFKKEIALIGDSMNTTARLLDACRESGRPVLASAALLERLERLPDGVVAEPMAPLALRGKAALLDVAALWRKDALSTATDRGADLVRVAPLNPVGP
jgi:adenylate cyclase